MNFFDVTVLVVLALFLIRGLFRGLIREASGIIGVAAAFYGANTYYPQLTPFLENLIDTPGIRNLICFFILFCGVLALISLLAELIRKFLNLVLLGWVDRFFGGLLGAAKGGLIICVLFLAIMAFVPGKPMILARSRTAPYVARAADALTLFVSQKNMKASFSRHLKGVQHLWKP